MGDISDRIAKLPLERRALLFKRLREQQFGTLASTPAPGMGDLAQLDVPKPWEAYRCVLRRPGVLETLQLQQNSVPPPGRGMIQLRTTALSLNFRDVLIAMGMYPPIPGFPSNMGSDYTGVVQAVGPEVSEFRPGDTVIALCAGSHDEQGTVEEGTHFNSVLNVHAEQAVLKPPFLEDEEAACIPTVFVTAFEGLCCRARLAKAERVLIHTATGGLGLAALQIARWREAEVFGTAGTPEKRGYLKSIGIREPMSSRSTEFADQLMHLTEDEGVDVVFNTLSGEATRQSLRVLRRFGRLIQVGKQDIAEGMRLDLTPFALGLTFCAVDLGIIGLDSKRRIRELSSEVIALFECGVLRPLPYRTFPISRIREALHTFSQFRHIGKIVVTFPS
jgi:NADPH:quinone reductase-like Zn-dependent oxidoreductase